MLGLLHIIVINFTIMIVFQHCIYSKHIPIMPRTTQLSLHTHLVFDIGVSELVAEIQEQCM